MGLPEQPAVWSPQSIQPLAGVLRVDPAASVRPQPPAHSRPAIWPRQHRSDEMIRFYVDELRPFAMYRGHENPLDWDDADEKLGRWKAAFTGRAPGER